MSDHAAYEAETDTIGMWLFLASEVMFFGALVFAYFAYQLLYPAAMADAVRHTNLPVGSINTVLLITSSFVLAAGTAKGEAGAIKPLIWCTGGCMGLGLLFLLLKSYEYYDDFRKFLVPGARFGLHGAVQKQIFFIFYFTATAIHAIHMLVGLGLMAALLKRAWRSTSIAAYATQLQVIGLYWSFVDIVWITLYPMLYLVGRR